MSVHGITTPKAGKVLTVNSDPEVISILEVNLTHANLEVISAQSGSEVLSKIHTAKPDIVILDPDLPDMDGMEICKRLKESPDTGQIPVILIGVRNHRKCRTIKAEDDAIHYIAKPFDPKEVVALVQSYMKRKERAENVHPLTGLPNQVQMCDELTELIEQKKLFAAIYIAMDDLKTFNKVYGYAQGDRTIGLLAEIVSEGVRLFGNPDDLVGHLGGDKFVVITTPWKARNICRRIVADFNRRVRTLYADEHLQRGYIAYESPLGSEEQSPIMSLHVVVVTNQKRTFYHHLEVSEAAAEQMDSLRRPTGSEHSAEADVSDIEPGLALTRRGIPYAHREELKAVHGILTWLDFIIGELNGPVDAIENCLNYTEQIPIKNFSAEQLNALKTIRKNVNQLTRVIEGLTHLTGIEQLMASAIFEEVNIGNTLSWITEQVHELASQRRIEIDVEGVEDIDHLMVDRRSFTQGLLYIVRGELQSSQYEGRLHVRATEVNGDFIRIQITNASHHIPQPTLDMLLQDQLNSVEDDALRNELYQAKLLIKGLGGKLNITSDKRKGITYTVIVPKMWQGWMQDVNALRLATEISRKEARTELKNINHLLSSLLQQVPPTIKDGLERLSGKIQELGVLCNRSLFLTDDLGSRLEVQQDYLLHHEVEQLSIIEAMLIIGEDIARSTGLSYIFDPDSAKRVTRYALAIAKEFRMSESECQALRYAALLKDLGLVLSAYDMVERIGVPTVEEAMDIRARFNPMWKALSTIPFLSSALVIIQYQYERYDGTGSRFGTKGTDIPLGARILAVAGAFDAMVSGLSPEGALTLKAAMQRITDDSGLRFDPDVINAFLRVWRRKELHLALRSPDKEYKQHE